MSFERHGDFEPAWRTRRLGTKQLVLSAAWALKDSKGSKQTAYNLHELGSRCCKNTRNSMCYVNEERGSREVFFTLIAPAGFLKFP